jgi:hypothetical protein
MVSSVFSIHPKNIFGGGEFEFVTATSGGHKLKIGLLGQVLIKSEGAGARS